MTHPERELEPIADLLHRAVDLSASERVAARNKFLLGVDAELESTHSRRRAYPYAVGLALAASVLLVFFLWRPHSSLEYSVRGAVRDGDYVRVGQDHAAELTFADEAHIHASPGTRLRIAGDSGRGGARIAVERGSIDVAIRHRDTTDWTFAAGPFQVHVTGTRFTLSWDAESERLEVLLREGSVDIARHVDSGSVVVKSGQRFVGDAKGRTMIVTDITAPLEQAAPAKPAESAVPEAPLPPSSEGEHAGLLPPQGTNPGPRPASKEAARASAPSWAALVAKGEFSRVVDEAAARGTQSCLASCSSEDLNALADAARYVGRADLAERVLISLRSRFAAGYGVRAAFLLGRLQERKGGMAKAKSWYDVALREGPGGAFASESLAGKMRAVEVLDGRAAARPVAREYLARYPKGVHAAKAKKLIEGP